MLALARRLDLPLRAFPAIVVLNLLWIGFEALGLGMLLPVLELLRTGQSVAGPALTGWYWDAIRSVTDFLGLELTLGFLLGTSFFFIVVRQAFKFANTVFNSWVSRTTADRLRRRSFQAYLRSRTDLQEQIRPGEFANEISVELDRAMSSIYSAVRAIGTVIQILFYIGGLMFLSPDMTLMSIGVFAILAYLLRRLFKAVKHTGSNVTDANNELGGFVVERMPRARLIRLSGAEKAEGKAFGELSRKQTTREFRHKIAVAKTILLPEPLAVAFAFSILYFGSQVFGLSLQTLGIFVIVLIRLLPVLMSCVSDYNSVVGKWASVKKIDRRLRQTMSAREGKGGTRTFARLDREIEYRNVTFHYRDADTAGDMRENAARALDDVTVKLPAHKMSALVGPSGAGKSTFVDLLPRLRDPTAGDILLDGVPISEFSMESLRGGIAFVPQEPQIFNISAAEHIRYGKEDATDAEVREAARLAGALDFILALPEGFESLLGDGGRRLSGGQRQRLDIARALVRRAPILVLDEPTSALDADAEGVFRDALKTLRRETDLTIIVIAHRLSTVADAENIVVMRDGHVDSVGTHEQLLREGGWYAGAYRQQSPEQTGATSATWMAG